ANARNDSASAGAGTRTRRATHRAMVGARRRRTDRRAPRSSACRRPSCGWPEPRSRRCRTGCPRMRAARSHDCRGSRRCACLAGSSRAAAATPRYGSPASRNPCAGSRDRRCRRRDKAARNACAAKSRAAGSRGIRASPNECPTARRSVAPDGALLMASRVSSVRAASVPGRRPRRGERHRRIDAPPAPRLHKSGDSASFGAATAAATMLHTPRACPGGLMKRTTSALLAFAVVLVAAVPLAAQDLTITNAHIVVGNGDVFQRGSIVVRGGRIVAVAEGAPASTSGQIIDAKGMSAMPGFIDAHRHVNTGPEEKAQMQRQLEAGYTTILSGGGPGDGNLTLRQHIESGQINGPRIIPSERLRLAGQTPESAREAVRQMKAAGINYTGEISLTPVPGPSTQELEVLRAVLDEGKKIGVNVQVHAVSSPAMNAAVEMGIPLLVHLPNKDWVSKADAQKLAAAGTKILMTIGFGAPTIDVFAKDNTPLFRDGKPWPDGIVDGVGGGVEAGYAMVNARTIFDAGGIIGYCTDTTYDALAASSTS